LIPAEQITSLSLALCGSGKAGIFISAISHWFNGGMLRAPGRITNRDVLNFYLLA
jgi:hypothetical protein